MLAKMIDKIVSLKETKIFEIGGQTYTDGHLTRIPPHVDRPEAISVSGLDGVCKLIRTELEKVDTTIMVQAKSYKSVEVMTTYLPDFSRNILYRAEADAPGLHTGFRGREVALIELRSLFIPNEGTAYLLDLLSRMTDEKSVRTNDNGVTQTVEARQGVSLNAMVDVKPRVMLRPFRTFLKGPRGDCMCKHPDALETFKRVCPRSPRMAGFIDFTAPGENVPKIKTSPRWCPLRTENKEAQSHE